MLKRFEDAMPYRLVFSGDVTLLAMTTLDLEKLEQLRKKLNPNSTSKHRNSFSLGKYLLESIETSPDVCRKLLGIENKRPKKR